MEIMHVMPLISIIVPVYNVREYLEVCIKSILMQTYSKLEVILIDDGSTDGSGAICDGFTTIDKRVSVIHKKNGGLSEARNIGLTIARGEYVGFVDSDDWIFCKMYEILLNQIIMNDADIAVCERILFGNGAFENCGRTGEIHICDREHALDILYEDKKYKSHVWNKLYKKVLFDQIDFPVGKYYEDVFVMHKLFGKATKVVFVDRGMYYYRQRAGSIVHQTRSDVWNDCFEAFNVRKKDITSCGREKLLFESYLNAVVRKRKTELNSENSKFYPNVYDGEGLFKLYSFKFGFYLLGKAILVTYFYPLFLALKRAKKATKYLPFFYFNRSFADSLMKNANSNKTRFILMGSPEYNNLGDLAIAYSIKSFVNSVIPGGIYIEIPEQSLRAGVFPNGVKKDDIILLVGGGNFGDYYIDQHIIRNRVLRKYKNNKIVIFPQTVFFSNTLAGKYEKKKTKKIIDNCEDLSVFIREKYSYKRISKWLNKSLIHLSPDIVLINDYDNIHDREGILLCLRSDSEALISDEKKQEVLNGVMNIGYGVELWDTCLPYNVSIDKRDNLVKNAIEYVSGFHLVITDRLHCMIFCAITGTPCLAIDNINHKILGTYKWLEGLGFIGVVRQISEIEAMSKKLLNDYPEGSKNRIDQSLFYELRESLLSTRRSV